MLLHTYVYKAKRNFLLAIWFEPYFSSFRFCSIYWFYYILLLFIFHLVIDFFIHSCVSLLIVFCWHFVGSKLNKCIYFNISSLAQCAFLSHFMIAEEFLFLVCTSPFSQYSRLFYFSWGRGTWTLKYAWNFRNNFAIHEIVYTIPFIDFDGVFLFCFGPCGRGTVRWL